MSSPFNLQQDQAAGLRRLMAAPKPRIVTILSATAGSELPRLLTNLAASLQLHGSDALIVHAAGADNEALRHYGIAGMPTLADVATGKQALSNVVSNTAHAYSAASLMPQSLYGRALDAQLVQRLNGLVAELAAQHEIVLVEAALNAAQQLPLALLNDGGIVIQLDRKPASIQQGYRLIKQLYAELGARPFGILVNSANAAEAQTVFNNIAGVARRYLHLKLEYFGHIPADEHLARATSLGRSVVDAFPAAAVSQAFAALASRFDHRQPIADLAPASYS